MLKRHPVKPHLLSLVLAVTAVSSVSAPTTVRAGGSAEFGVDYYIAPPLVQGSYVSDFLEDFNGGTQGAGECLGPRTSGGITVTISNTCDRLGGMVLWGGATTTTATPTAGGTETNFGSTSNPYTGPIRFDIDADMCYLGFWWSAGSIGNVVDFYDGDTLVLTLSTNEIMSVLDPSIDPNLLSLGATSYPKTAWNGLPRLHTDTSPADGLPDGSPNPNEPFVYMHVFAQGGLTFNRMEFSTTGNGFEFDNLVISDECQLPTSDLVRIGSVSGNNPNSGGPSSDYSGYLEHLQQVTELPNTR